MNFLRFIYKRRFVSVNPLLNTHFSRQFANNLVWNCSRIFKPNAAFPHVGLLFAER